MLRKTSDQAHRQSTEAPLHAPHQGHPACLTAAPRLSRGRDSCHCEGKTPDCDCEKGRRDQTLPLRRLELGPWRKDGSQHRPHLQKVQQMQNRQLLQIRARQRWTVLGLGQGPGCCHRRRPRHQLQPRQLQTRQQHRRQPLDAPAGDYSTHREVLAPDPSPFPDLCLAQQQTSRISKTPVAVTLAAAAMKHRLSRWKKASWEPKQRLQVRSARQLTGTRLGNQSLRHMLRCCHVRPHALGS